MLRCACVLIVAVSATACDLPTDALSARAELSSNTDAQISMPLPDVQLSLAEELSHGNHGLPITIDTVKQEVTLTLPTQGVSLERRISLSEDSMVLRVAQSVDSARVDVAVLNHTSLTATIVAAIAPTPADTAGFDPFTAANHILLPAFTVAAGAQGGPQQQSVAITPEMLSVLQSPHITVAARATVSAAGPVRILSSDFVRMSTSMKLAVGTARGHK